MENGEWRMENGEWRMENGELLMLFIPVNFSSDFFFGKSFSVS